MVRQTVSIAPWGNVHDSAALVLDAACSMQFAGGSDEFQPQIMLERIAAAFVLLMSFAMSIIIESRLTSTMLNKDAAAVTVEDQ